MKRDERRAVDDELLTTPAWLSPVTCIWLTGEGLCIPRLDGPPEWVWGPGRPDLDLVARRIQVERRRLVCLAALSAAPGAPPRRSIDRAAAKCATDDDVIVAQLVQFVADLRTAGLLVDQAPPDRLLQTPPSTQWARMAAARNVPVRPGPDQRLRLVVPSSVAVRNGQFLVLDHDDGVVASLGPTDILVASAFADGTTVDAAFAAVRSAHPTSIRERSDFERRVGSLLRSGLLQAAGAMAGAVQVPEAPTEPYEIAEQALLDALAEERRHLERTGTRRHLVIAPDADNVPALALAMLLAYAKVHRGGALLDRYRFAPLLYTTPERYERLLSQLGDWPVVVLFSQYMWTSDKILAMSAATKVTLPEAITVHGGPDVPKYEGDAARWFAENPQVDVAVRGEGEITLAEALDALVARPGGPADLGALHDVAGLNVRTRGGVHRAPDRDRLADLDVLPSPYLTGEFDNTARFSGALILETNRGCPYGCTFCDWGSATLSRIRKFDEQRVRDEMLWGAQHGLELLFLSDANFGMLERDLSFTEWAVELRRRYGYPNSMYVSFAKNRVGNLAKIVETLREGGISSTSVASVQSFDREVLTRIKRSNIKIERYDALTDEFRRSGMPLYTDILVGLPGSTPAKLCDDFQGAIDRELQIRAMPTSLLVNSPMNDPAYRAEQGIVARPGQLVKQTSTFDRADWDEMMTIRRFVYLAERNGMLRQVATYVRAETGRREIDVYEAIRRAGDSRSTWPFLAYLVHVVPDEFVAPGSWWPVLDEVQRFCIDELGVVDDDALATAIGVQHALLPAPGRCYPQILDLPHDYALWHAQVLDAKLAHTDGRWPDFVPALRTFGPGVLKIDDSRGSSNVLAGLGSTDNYLRIDWELDSPVSRPKEPTPSPVMRKPEPVDVGS